MRTMRRPCLLVPLAFLLFGACRNVDDYLNDLDRIDPRAGRSVFEQTTVIFDEGQLAHEALVGLADADRMARWQAVRSLARGARFLGRARDNALLRADGAVLIRKMAMGIPVPPITEPFDSVEGNVEEVAIKQINRLFEARRSLGIAAAISRIEGPDEVVRQDAIAELESVTGEHFGRDTDAWRKWWEENRTRIESEFMNVSREPIRILGSMRFKNASASRELLSLLSLWLKDHDKPGLREVLRPAVDRIARQTVVHALSEAVSDPDPQVRADVARAMAAVRDIDFGEPLLRQFQRERQTAAAIEIAKALVHYPSRRTIRMLIDVLHTYDERLVYNADRALVQILGIESPGDAEAWENWWTEVGDKSWP